MKYYFYHLLTWPQLLWVAEDFDGTIVGYCLAKLEEQEVTATSSSNGGTGIPTTIPKHGHITSLSVLRTYRKRGIATMLMQRSQQEMYTVFDAEYVSLHVRQSNKAAFHLYNNTLRYEVHGIEKGYYADGEDAYDMRCYFHKQQQLQQIIQQDKEQLQLQQSQFQSEQQQQQQQQQHQENNQKQIPLHQRISLVEDDASLVSLNNNIDNMNHHQNGTVQEVTTDLNSLTVT